jgi:hypothetical protein
MTSEIVACIMSAAFGVGMSVGLLLGIFIGKELS